MGKHSGIIPGAVLAKCRSIQKYQQDGECIGRVGVLVFDFFFFKIVIKKKMHNCQKIDSAISRFFDQKL